MHALPVLSSEQGLTKYIEEVNHFPYLEQDEEYYLAKKWTEEEDIEAAHQLVTSHLRLVVKIAMGFRGYGLPLLEMISEGNVGLMQAVKKFEPEKGFRLSTYAIWWIKASIQEYILRSWSLVKIGTTASQKRLFFGLRKIKKRLQKIDNNSLSHKDVATIAHELDVSEKDVIDMNMRLTFHDQSLNNPVGNDEEGSGSELIDFLEDNENNQEILIAENQDLSHKRKALGAAMDRLNPREQYIIEHRKLKEEPDTLEDLSMHFGISRERVRQIEARAMEKLQHMVQEQDNYNK